MRLNVKDLVIFCQLVTGMREWSSEKRDVFDYRKGEFEMCNGNILPFSDSARVL